MEIDPYSETSKDPYALGNSLQGFIPPFDGSTSQSNSKSEVKRGVIIGKFFPFHLGHQYLCEQALQYCDELYVIVCYRPNEYPALNVRVSWLRHSLPKIYCMGIHCVYNAYDSQLWAELTKAWCKFIPDFVFTSEEYGVRWASFLGCQHIMVDHARARHRVSGTMIRETLYDPVSYQQSYFTTINKSWNKLPWIVQHHFTKQVIVLTADDTVPPEIELLCKRLAGHYKGIYLDQGHKEDTRASIEIEFSAMEFLTEELNKIIFQDNRFTLHKHLFADQDRELLINDEREVFCALKSMMLLCLMSEEDYASRIVSRKAIIEERSRSGGVMIDTIQYAHIDTSKKSATSDGYPSLDELIVEIDRYLGIS